MEYMSKEEVLERLLPKTCIDIMHDTFLSFANGRFEQYLRTAQPLPQGNIFGFMPAYLGEWFGAKLITVFPQNHSAGLPSHQGIVLLFDSATGTLRFAADGDAITAVRTGAVSALATDLLANPSASTLALIGAGAQARSHLAAISCVRPLSKVTVWDRSPSAAERFARELSSPSLPVVHAPPPGRLLMAPKSSAPSRRLPFRYSKATGSPQGHTSTPSAHVPPQTVSLQESLSPAPGSIATVSSPRLLRAATISSR